MLRTFPVISPPPVPSPSPQQGPDPSEDLLPEIHVTISEVLLRQWAALSAVVEHPLPAVDGQPRRRYLLD